MQYITAQSAQVLGSFQLHCSLGTVMFRYRYQIPPKDGSSHHNSSGLVPMAYQCTHGWSSRVHAHPGRLLSTWKSQTSHRGSSKPGPGSTASTSSKKSHVSYNPLNWKSLLEQSRWKCASLLCCHGLQEYKLVCFKLRQQDSCAVTTEISSHLDHLWWGKPGRNKNPAGWATWTWNESSEPSRLGSNFSLLAAAWMCTPCNQFEDFNLFGQYLRAFTLRSFTTRLNDLADWILQSADAC